MPTLIKPHYDINYKVNYLDFNFKINYQTKLDQLKQCISAYGLIHHPNAVYLNKEITIYEGNLRFLACFELGLTPEILIHDISIKEALYQKLTITKNYNPLEINYILLKAEELNCDKKIICSLLNINFEKIANYLQLNKLPEFIRKKLLDTPEFLKSALKLLIFSEQDVRNICNILEHFQLNTNQSYEFINIYDELKLKNEPINLADLAEIEEQSRNKANELIDFCRKKRYPNYHILKQKLIKYLQKLSNKTIKLNYKDNFENNTALLSTELKTTKDIDKLVKYLDSNKQELSSFLNFIKEPQ